MNISQHATSLLCAVLAIAALAPNARAAASDTSLPAGQPRAITKQLTLPWSKLKPVQLQTIAAAWHAVARAEFTSAPVSERYTANAVRTGPLAWVIAADGALLLDTRTGERARIPALNSNEVRPQELAYDSASGSVWLYGAGLYRYRIASRILEKFTLSAEAGPALRKIAYTQGLLWLATEHGIYVLDTTDGSLQALQHPALAGASIAKLAAREREAWLAASDSRLFRVSLGAPGQPTLMSGTRLPGVPAQIALSGQSLWLLLEDRHGDHYTLAVAGAQPDKLGIFPGKYYSLSERDGRLTVGAYGMSYRIDPLAYTLAPVKAQESGALAQAMRKTSLLYAGFSYDYKDGCEVVEHGQPDLSKGWFSAMGDAILH
jgi:hypothetical protein